MMQGLPALAEGDIVKFGDVVTQLQQSVGKHFAVAQGGIFASPEVGKVVEWLAGQGAVALGQTSWGPTGFCIIEGIEKAASLTKIATEKFAHFQTVNITSASAKNSGGDVLLE